MLNNEEGIGPDLLVREKDLRIAQEQVNRINLFEQNAQKYIKSLKKKARKELAFIKDLQKNHSLVVRENFWNQLYDDAGHFSQNKIEKTLI